MLHINRKIIVVMIVMAIISISTVTASAASGYATKNMNSSYSYTQYNCSFWGQENFWDVWWGADGTSCTRWMGTSPYNADSISHNDILSCSGVGSMSIGCNPSGPNVSATISGHSATFAYSLSNTWQINVDFNYKLIGLLAAWNLGMRTSSVVQFGSNFYTWGT